MIREVLFDGLSQRLGVPGHNLRVCLDVDLENVRLEWVVLCDGSVSSSCRAGTVSSRAYPLVLAHARQVGHDVDAVLGQCLGRADTRDHQELGRTPLQHRFCQLPRLAHGRGLCGMPESLTTPAVTMTSFRAERVHWTWESLELPSTTTPVARLSASKTMRLAMAFG